MTQPKISQSQRGSKVSPHPSWKRLVLDTAVELTLQPALDSSGMGGNAADGLKTPPSELLVHLLFP